MANKARYDLDRDVRTLEAMASRLKPYIYESELYGPMPGDLPRLTVGGLLMRLNRLPALPLSPSQQKVVEKARAQFDEISKEWRVAYEGKIEREMKTRLAVMHQFLDECPESITACADNYPSAIEKRVMLESLKDAASAINKLSPELKDGLLNVDNKIHRYFAPSDNFTWDSQLQPAYPRDKFWYLYTKPAR